MILSLHTRGDLLRWCTLLLFEHITRYPFLWCPEHSRCSGSLYFPIFSAAATCRCVQTLYYPTNAHSVKTYSY